MDSQIGVRPESLKVDGVVETLALVEVSSSTIVLSEATERVRIRRVGVRGS